MTDTEDAELDDLLPDDLLPAKGKAAPLVRTPRQKAAIAKRQEQTKAEADLANQQSKAQADAARLAQVVNLHIAGMSLAQIGAAIGASADEVDRMLMTDTQRYVRTQPALRVYVRNFISERYNKLLEAVWDEATDKNHREKLEHQDRALRILDRMERLHGAAAPTQTEVKVDAMPEIVEKMVTALATSQGLGYDTSIFDVVDAEVVHESVDRAAAATLDAGERVGEMQEGDPEDGF
jgi:hypothetical protein